jgi:hypothetical protein
MSDFIKWLLQQGWSKSVASLEMISPHGRRYSYESINALEPVFQKAKHNRHTLDALKYTVPHDPGIGPLAKQGDIISDNAGKLRVFDNGQWREVQSQPPIEAWSPYEMLKMRLHVKASETFGMDYCNIHEGPNVTFVFLVKGDKSIVLEDHTALFPSDALVAAFRLFQQATE